MRMKLSTLVLLLAFFALGAASAFGQSPKPQPDENGVYPGGNGVKVASLTHAAPAVPSGNPQLNGVKHVCALLVDVGADGALKRVAVANRVASPFDDAAITAVRHSEFEPGSLNGKPVATRLLVWVPFLADGQPAVPVGGPLKAGKMPAGLKSLTHPVPIYTPEAEFSDEARRAHYAGAVLFQVLVDEGGLPTYVRLLAGAGKGLDENAFSAVRKYRFRPATLEGIPVPFLMIIKVNFRFS